MKKVGILTYWTSKDNYGQILQCYALQQVLIKIGTEPFLIKYLPFKKQRSIIEKVIKSISIYRIKYYFSKQHKMEKENALLIKRKYEYITQKNTIRNFDLFMNDYIISDKKIYTNIAELKASAPDADVFVCGSDQVWNNDLTDVNTAGWFLEFTDKKKISYAASIGRNYTDAEVKLFTQKIKNFNAVSVREDSAKKLCNRVGIEAKLVLDPTLLLTSFDYSKIISQIDKKVDVFVYIINISDFENVYWPNIRDYINANNFSFAATMSSGYLPAYEGFTGYNMDFPTIQQWLAYIRDSKRVVTSSFHGVVFSILFHTEFAVIKLGENFAASNDRISTLLKQLNICDRYVDDSNISDIFLKKINWEEVDDRLLELRFNSLDFIRNNIL